MICYNDKRYVVLYFEKYFDKELNNIFYKLEIAWIPERPAFYMH